MKKIVLYNSIILLVVMFCTPYLSGQSPIVKDSVMLLQDSLTLSDVLKVVTQNHPSVKHAEEALNATDALIGIAKAGYLPNIDISASYAHIGPVPTVSFGGQSLVMAPADNINAGLNYYQTIYDFGRTSRDIKLQQEHKNSANINITLVKQAMARSAVNTFYLLQYYQEAVVIKNKQLATLHDHLDEIKKKIATGSSTKYELLTTQVRISITESQLIDLETSQKRLWAVMDMLTGLPTSTNPKVKKEIFQEQITVPSDSLVDYANTHSTELAAAKEAENLAELQYDFAKTSDMPTLNLVASAGGKNGYFPVLGDIRANYVVGLNLRVPLFDGNRKKNSLSLAKTNVSMSNYNIEIVRRNKISEIVEINAIRIADQRKIKQFELQLTQAEENFAQSQINYTSGAITNLEVLDAELLVSDSRVQLLRARIDSIISNYNLKIAIGDKPYEN